MPDGTTVLLRADLVHAAHVFGVILAKLSDDERRAWDVMIKLEEMNQMRRNEATKLVRVEQSPAEREFFRETSTRKEDA